MRQEHVDMAQYVNQTNTFDQHRTIENMANDLHQAFTDVTCMREALHQCSHSNVTGVLHVLHQLHLLVLEATGRQGEAVPMPRCHSNRWECRQWKEHPEMSLSFGFHVVSAALHFADTMAEECDRVAPHLE
nr:hypothetical protein BaRGS_031198 [Batillaria attramentaria]